MVESGGFENVTQWNQVINVNVNVNPPALPPEIGAEQYGGTFALGVCSCSEWAAKRRA